MKHIFIVNPISGPQDAGRAWLPKVEAAAQEIGIDYSVEITAAPRHATELAFRAAEKYGNVRLYAVGGDGTLNEVFAGAYSRPGVQVAHVPVGSGNDFVRNFGTAQDFLNLANLIRGESVAIDLMDVDGGVCAAITSVGMDADVAYNIPKYRRLPLLGGSMAYNLSVATRLLRPLGRRLRITADGKAMAGRYLIATVCNGRYYGGGWCAAPEADLADGLLDVILVRKVSRAKIASIIGSYKNGQHVQNGHILSKFNGVMQLFRAKEVSFNDWDNDSFILNVDGECGPAQRLYAKVMPLAGNFVLPAGLSAEGLHHRANTLNE